MTIFLSNEPQAFRDAFDRACDRVVNSKQDRVFYSLYATLVEALRTHPLVGNYLLDFEKNAEKMDFEFSEAAFHAMEEEWMLLWKTHSKNWRIRIELAKIKTILTRPRGITFSSLFHQLNFALLQLRFCSHFCGTPENQYLVSKKRMDLIAKTSIQGNNALEKRRTMRALAAIYPSFCWSRMKFFLSCWNFNETISLPQPSKGSWEEIGRTAWNAMWSACDKMVLLGAKMDFNNGLDDPDHHPSPFVNAEHQIIRKDNEEYLAALKQHLWNHLLQLEQTFAEQKIEAEAKEKNPLLTLPGTQRDSFAIELAIKCWKKNPAAKYSEVYEDYLVNCPAGRRLAHSTWERVISKAKIDPRPKDAKVRGEGKKTLQKSPAI